ncbi:hypothetical protein BDF21DRAFT_494350 [Thamnidium elegans]|nr:hypothetical protein BDF21DRAFT_494350 [Thamnidium elegans]
MGRLQDNQYTPLLLVKDQNKAKLKEERANNEAKLQETFCPPLDPSLIQAIWNDSYNYDASFEILSSLAKDTEQTLDQEEEQEAMQAMEQLELDESTTTNESEDDNVNFLFTCFPTLPLDNLVGALKATDNDIEKATDLLLSQEYLQDVEDTGGFVVDKSEEDSYYEKKNTDVIKKKPKKKSKKKGTVWSSGKLPNPSSTSVNNTIDHDAYDELATVPFNSWHQYDASINKIQGYFPIVPKMVVATCVQQCRGNIIASVKMVMEKRPTEKPEHEMSWTMVKDLTNVKQELEAIMVDRSMDDIYRVSVGVIIQFEGGKEKTVDQMVQAGIEHFLSFDISQQALEARLRKMAKESEVIRKKKKKNGMPVIPEYLLINNQNNYVDDDPEECRDIAMQLIMERNELFRKAAAAYRQAKNKGPGEGGIAFYYSDNARQIDSRAKDWNMRAARATVRNHRIRHNDDHLLDLHGLTVAEAQVLVQEGVTQWWSRSQMQSSRRQFQPLKIITGIGKHSESGAKLLPATIKLLKKGGWLFEMTNPGCIYVKGVINK